MRLAHTIACTIVFVASVVGLNSGCISDDPNTPEIEGGFLTLENERKIGATTQAVDTLGRDLSVFGIPYVGDIAFTISMLGAMVLGIDKYIKKGKSSNGGTGASGSAS